MSSYAKTVLRSIRGSLGRFLAILAIIALGVGFYSGLSETMPSFMKTGDKFIREHKLYDFRLLSTIGFDEEDIDKLSDTEGVKAAAGAYYKDAIVCYSDDSETRNVVRFHSLTEGINVPELTAGRMPEASDEILADGYRLSDDRIGKTLVITSDNDDDTIDSLPEREYTIVGIIRSPYYLNFQRSTTNIGGGTIDYYVYAPEGAFDMEYYTEAYLFYDTDYVTYSDEYEEFADAKSTILESEVQGIIDARFDDLVGEAWDEYYDALDEYNDKRADAINELNDARLEIDDAGRELSDARTELDDAQSDIDDARREIADAQQEIDDNAVLLDQRERELNDGLAQINSGIEQAQATKSELESELSEVDATIAMLEAQLEEVNRGIAVLEQMEQLMQSQAEQLALQTQPDATATPSETAPTGQTPTGAAGQTGETPADTPTEPTTPPELPYTMEELLANKQMLEDGLAQARSGKEQLEDGIAQADQALTELQARLEEARAGEQQLNEARTALDNARSELSSARSDLDSGISDYESGLDEYDEGYAEYMDGVRQYWDGVIEFQNSMAAANMALAKAYDNLSDVERPDTYVLGRDTNVGYVSFDNDAHIVEGIANVFPVFFFALAALVCSTTMQRMVSDERTHIGTMRALGYSDFAIVMKYVVYSGTASVIGCVGGYLGGIKLFPYVIWQVYGVMYGFAPIVFDSSVWIFLLSLVVSLLCSVGVTVVTAMSELKGMPAELIRPKAPQAGKKILLERVGFIWRRLKFTHKVSIRNVFRFKKRMWMMIIGIAGCTALLITGFGLRDSINDIVDIQYDSILTYNILLGFEDGTSTPKMKAATESADIHFGVNSKSVLVRTENLTHNGVDAIRDVNLIVSDDPEILSAAQGVVDGAKMPWPGDGEVAISSKLALKNDLKAGDIITLGYGDEGKSFDVKIAYVFDNYIFHYAFMNGSTYEQAFGEKFDPNTLLVVRTGENSPEETGVTDYDYASYAADSKDVKLYSVVADSRSSFRETMKQLNQVVVLIIGCAAALAFIVLFNLNNINITERIREIATLKVLGFNRMETGSYVFRENFILSFFGFLLGIPLGIALHAFVIAQIEMDTVTFVVQIFPLSYVLSLGFVILFSVIVDLVMRGKIERIDMAESLKSIE